METWRVVALVLAVISIAIGSFAVGFNLCNLIHLKFDERHNKCRNTGKSANNSSGSTNDT